MLNSASRSVDTIYPGFNYSNTRLLTTEKMIFFTQFSGNCRLNDTNDSFSLQCLQRTYDTKGRKFPPSYKEVACVTKRFVSVLLLNISACPSRNLKIFNEFTKLYFL